MDKYMSISILSLISYGYLALLFLDICKISLKCAKRNHWRLSSMIKEVSLSFKNTYGLGSLSILLFSLAIVWLNYCDEFLTYLKLASWSNVNEGIHIGSFYALGFSIPAFILAYKFNKHFGAKLFMKLSGLFSFVYGMLALLLFIHLI